MKKILLIATFGVAGMISAKNNVLYSSECSKYIQIEEQLYSPDQECGVLVTYYGSDGQVNGHHLYSSDQPSVSACQSYQARIRQMLLQRGFTLTEEGPLN